ncbi:MAG: sulfurtransferase TusA family protein [Pseudomonadales bacterium]|nr:sulfurtransferase TusA family protein [Pseudomonadales bacterium]
MTNLKGGWDLDLSGLRCPLPLLRLKQSLQKMPPGASMLVRTTDPASERDFRLYLEQSGHRLLEVVVSKEDIVFHIIKAEHTHG